MSGKMAMIKTTRLLLRPWRQEDLEPFAKLNADPRVMEYFPALRSWKESEDFIKAMQHLFETQGWGLWAVSLISSDAFIGFIGLGNVSFTAPFTPAVEVGWRLAFEYWGQGYATEGAMASLKYGFEVLNLSEIVAFTPVQNKRSRAVMERIGMHHDAKDDFDHPKITPGHPLQRHVLYRIKWNGWQQKEVDHD
jgi:3-dehydroquinate dehydratase/shikimate dehydrogenase